MTQPPDASRTGVKSIQVALVAMIRRGPSGWEVLLTKRPQHVHLGGFWELPGGKIEEHGCDGEPTESPSEAAARELREELGILVGPERLEACGETTHAYPDRTIRFHLFIHQIERAGWPTDELTEHVHTWVSIDKIDFWDLPPANVAVNQLLIDWLGSEEVRRG